MLIVCRQVRSAYVKSLECSHLEQRIGRGLQFAVNEGLVGDRTVTLRFDAERRDVYGRLLAYVYLPRAGGRPLFVNAALLRGGYATTLTIAPNVRFADRFAALARQARDAGRGLWSACER